MQRLLVVNNIQVIINNISTIRCTGSDTNNVINWGIEFEFMAMILLSSDIFP